MRNFRKYDAWQNALQVVETIYQLTKCFPEDEKYGLTNQVRRAAVSIASNIAEGASRESEVDFARFLEISLGSAFEVETQILIANQLGYVTAENYEPLLNQLTILQKQINSLISKIRQKRQFVSR